MFPCVLQLNFPGTQELEILLEDESHQACAEAMFAVMYEVPGVLEQQDQPTLVLMTMLALQHDIPRVATAAIQKLSAAELTPDGLQALCDLPAWPSPMYPLLEKAIQAKLSSEDEGQKAAAQKMLVCAFVDLEEVWTETDDARRNMLVGLSKDALLLLLQSAEVKVASEDTILYTIASSTNREVKKLLQKLPKEKTQQARAQELREERAPFAALVRVPHLTPEALASIVPQLEWLTDAFTLKQLFLASYMQQQGLHEEITSVPETWRQAARPASAVHGCIFSFAVDVKELEQAGEKAAASGVGKVRMRPVCPARAFAGRGWKVQCELEKEEGEGVELSLYRIPRFPGLKDLSFVWRQQGKLQHGTFQYGEEHKSDGPGDTAMQGVGNFFDLCPMPNGWEWDAWKAKGLPASGELVIELVLKN